MKKHIYDESNGLSYTLHGDYYLPDLAVNEEEPTYGKYGMLRKQFLKEHRPARYQDYLFHRDGGDGDDLHIGVLEDAGGQVVSVNLAGAAGLCAGCHLITVCIG